mgnify:CR=1 FL=1
MDYNTQFIKDNTKKEFIFLTCECINTKFTLCIKCSYKIEGVSMKKEHKITQQTLSNRKRKHKTFFLTKTEAKAFSQYLGYDLMKN